VNILGFAPLGNLIPKAKDQQPYPKSLAKKKKKTFIQKKSLPQSM
jgi:hypothetical protein